MCEKIEIEIETSCSEHQAVLIDGILKLAFKDVDVFVDQGVNVSIEYGVDTKKTVVFKPVSADFFNVSYNEKEKVAEIYTDSGKIQVKSDKLEIENIKSLAPSQKVFATD